jgi:Tfp pilus assembly protein PilV
MRPTSKSGPTSRRAFALAELLVATTLLVVGLLAVAGTASYLARAESAARVAARAAEMLAERVERVAGSACGDSSGARASFGVRERWRTSRDAGLARLVDSASYTIAGAGARLTALDVAARCLP